jgi:predicted MFS family arabinose efflux permease
LPHSIGSSDRLSTGWGSVLLILLAGVIAAMQIGKVAPALPALRSDLALGMVTGGWVGSIFTGVAAVLSLAAGIAADRIGHRAMMLSGLGVIAIGSLLGALAPDEVSLLVTRLIEGVGFVLIIVSAPALIARSVHGPDQHFAFGLWSSYMPIGVTLMLLLSPSVLAIGGWRGLWMANAAFAALFTVVLGLRIAGDAGTGPSRARPWNEIPQVVSRWGPWLLGGCFAVYTIQWSAVIVWLPTFLIETQAMAASLAAVLSAVAAFANAPGNVAGGFLLRAGVPRWLVVLGASATMGALGFGIYAGSVSDLVRYAMVLAFSFFSGMIPAAALAGVPLHAPAAALVASTAGLVIQIANLGNLLGPPGLAAIVSVAGGWQGAGWLLLAVSLLGIAVALWLRVVERRVSLRPQRIGA